MLPSKPDDCNRGILQRAAFEIFLQRYDLLSELVARLETQSSGGIPRARIIDSLVGTLWTALSRRSIGIQATYHGNDEPEMQVTSCIAASLNIAPSRIAVNPCACSAAGGRGEIRRDIRT